MTHCVVKGCLWYKNKPYVKFITFPKTEKEQKLWLRDCKRPSLKPMYKEDGLCQFHFHPKDLIIYTDVKKKPRLRRDPTIRPMFFHWNFEYTGFESNLHEMENLGNLSYYPHAHYPELQSSTPLEETISMEIESDRSNLNENYLSHHPVIQEVSCCENTNSQIESISHSSEVDSLPKNILMSEEVSSSSFVNKTYVSSDGGPSELQRTLEYQPYPHVTLEEIKKSRLRNVTVQQNLLDFSNKIDIGKLVWGFFENFWYPGLVVNADDVGQLQIDNEHWIFWIGDDRTSSINKKKLLLFGTNLQQALFENKKKRMSIKLTRTFDEMFNNSAELIMKKSNGQINLKEWDTSQLDLKMLNEIDRMDFYPYPKEVERKISRIYFKKMEEFYPCPLHLKKKPEFKTDKTSSNEYFCVQNCCISCKSSTVKILRDHPIFEAKLCLECFLDYEAKYFAFDREDNMAYCKLCGGEELSASCPSKKCFRKICNSCVGELFPSNPSYFDEQISPSLPCLFCNDNAKEVKILLNENWKIYEETLRQKYHASFLMTSNPVGFCRRKIVVFSVCDGICSGMEIISRRLELCVDKYYSTEIKESAKIVTSAQFGDRVTQLGNLKEITEDKIKALCPIDLLIGGTPCQDLSGAKSDKDPFGENSDSSLFFNYADIRKWIMKHNKPYGVYLFFLFENVASMPKECCDVISEHLQRQPVFIDSVHFSCMHRPRLYWGNTIFTDLAPVRVFLQDKLAKGLSRKATVLKLRTITRQTHSLLQGSKEHKAVEVNGVPTDLWTTEIETIFGYPLHYTGFGNLSKKSRFELLGNSWCVETVTKILSSLQYYFRKER